MEITSFSQLESVIRDAVKNSMEDLGKKGEEVAKENIEKVVYGAYSPVEYERTGQLKDSITSKETKNTGNSFEVEIYHDTSKITEGYPNQHMSVITEASSAHSIAEIVHDGKAPNIFNDKNYAWMSARPYMDTTKDEIIKNKLHIKTVKDSLKSQGFDVE